jgi:hypothetical protein
MYTDPILEEKWKVQKELAQEAHYDINTFMKNAHKNVVELAKAMSIELKYAKRKGGYRRQEGNVHFFEQSGTGRVENVAEKSEETYGKE